MRLKGNRAGEPIAAPTIHGPRGERADDRVDSKDGALERERARYESRLAFPGLAFALGRQWPVALRLLWMAGTRMNIESPRSRPSARRP